ncbi:MAG: hypothetical protein O3A53_06795 [Acidobacteria bacterium]|nr:hypothetical protein [Acidobacteriota bacterium]MDA1234490.1 hypothetical protein [Acidobacteriota bacterium]
MNRLARLLVDKLSLALEPHERDAVRGDQTESGATAWQALREILGLVIRRQLQLWKDWRPWLVLGALVLPLGTLLSLTSRRVAASSSVTLWMYLGNWTPIFLESPGSRSDLLRYAVTIGNQYLVLACWSWAVGLLLGPLSRRTIPVNGILFSIAVWFASLLGTRYMSSSGPLGALFPLRSQALLVLLPAIWGMRQGRRLANAPASLRNLVFAFALVTVAVFATRNWGWVLCAWGSLQSCGEWAVQMGTATRAGVPLVKQLPILPLTLIGPVGYLLAMSVWRYMRRRVEAA